MGSALLPQYASTKKEIIVPSDQNIFSLMNPFASLEVASAIDLGWAPVAKAVDRVTHDPQSEVLLFTPGYGMSSLAGNRIASSVHAIGQGRLKHGIDVVYTDFSWRGSEASIRSHIKNKLTDLLDSERHIHIVTHSLGGPLMVEIINEIQGAEIDTIHFINAPHKGISYIKVAPSEMAEHFLEKGEAMYEHGHMLTGKVREIHSYISDKDGIVHPEDQISSYVDDTMDMPATDHIYQGDQHTTLLIGSRAHHVAETIVDSIVAMVETRKLIAKLIR